MAYLGFERVVADGAVRDITNWTVPGNATWVELQADTQDVRYTMDGATDPAQASGMILLTTEPPKLFLIEDLQRIRYTRGAGADGAINAHYGAGRDV
jgi:hypothetical protein